MNAPLRKRPTPGKLGINIAQERLIYASDNSSYTGSPEHKDTQQNPLIERMNPRPRANASICPRGINDREIVNAWLREAISKGCIGEPWLGEFPRYVWYFNEEENCVYMARLTNQENGEYKGWPISREEWPKGIEAIWEN